VIEEYQDGDSYAWIPVATEKKKKEVRAFLPFNGLDETYLHGYKARISESKYLEALSDIQRAYIKSESKIFSVNNGTKDVKQYKAKWRHGRERNAPLLGPTKGWVKVKLSRIQYLNDSELGMALDESSDRYCQLEDSNFKPVLCNSAEELIEEAEKLKEIIGDRIPEGQRVPNKCTTSQKTFIRDAAVVAYVLCVANGSCECCGDKSPFIKSSGEPYLEVHHVRHLAKGGSDTISNAIAICPNCHRELHFGINSELLVERLYLKLDRLIHE
jgi:5-methylcytosine-specific restriction protein A